jgi:competence protein ComEC
MALKKSLKFFYSCLFFIVGVALGEFLPCDWFVFICVGGAVIVILNLFQDLRPPIRFAMVGVLFLVFGCFWNNLFNPTVNKDHLAFYNNQKKVFVGKVVAEPVNQGAKQSLTIAPEKLKGKLLLKKELYPIYQYGDLLEINCELVPPKPIEDFQYDKFLAKSGVYSLCYNAKIKLLARDQGNFLLSKIFSFKSFLLERLNKTASEPQAALLAGILLGARTSLPATLSDQFNRVGVTHIIAISGYNITILVVVLLNLAKSFYINRKKATFGVLLFLGLFVILTGASGSVIRAGIMGGLVVFAKYLGRKSAVRNVLILSATAMLIFNPKILFWDAGFQLSFLATIGLIYLGPAIKQYFQWLPERFSLRENFISTISAIIITLPLILFNFGRLSLVAPIVNILILPAIPVIMFIGFWQMFFSLFSIFLGSIIGWGSWLFLTYVIKIVEVFSSLPFAAIDLKVAWWMMIVLYILIIFFIFKRTRRRKLSTFASPKKIEYS